MATLEPYCSTCSYKGTSFVATPEEANFADDVACTLGACPVKRAKKASAGPGFMALLGGMVLEAAELARQQKMLEAQQKADEATRASLEPKPEPKILETAATEPAEPEKKSKFWTYFFYVIIGLWLMGKITEWLS